MGSCRGLPCSSPLATPDPNRRENKFRNVYQETLLCMKSFWDALYLWHIFCSSLSFFLPIFPLIFTINLSGLQTAIGGQNGRLIFIHLQCWEVLPFCRFQRQRCIKIRVLRAQDFYTLLALKCQTSQHLPALDENNFDHPHPPILAKKYAPKICHKMRGRMA